ncbi:MAG: hypothetical protein Q8K78_16390 [Planctomycetaceae bacterium]|nr:hypothetical protein [Planctomycetaceae bacterium]
MKWILMGFSLTMLGWLAVGGDAIAQQCPKSCKLRTFQFGIGFNGDFFCHKFSTNTALELYDTGAGNADQAVLNGNTIQRWEKRNCCNGACATQVPAAMVFNNCQWAASIDWDDRDCEAAEQ